MPVTTSTSTSPLNHPTTTTTDQLQTADRIYRFILQRAELTPEHHHHLTSYEQSGCGFSDELVTKLQFASTTTPFINAIEEAKQRFTEAELLQTPGFWTTTTTTSNTKRDLSGSETLLVATKKAPVAAQNLVAQPTSQPIHPSTPDDHPSKAERNILGGSLVDPEQIRRAAITQSETNTSTQSVVPPAPVCVAPVESDRSDLRPVNSGTTNTTNTTTPQQPNQSNQHHQHNHNHNQQIKTRPFFPNHPYLVIPLFTVRNNQHYIFGLKFRTNAKDDKNKYHAFSRSQNRTQGKKRSRITATVRTTPLKQHIYYPHYNDQADILVITEGEKKAICLLDQQQRLSGSKTSEAPDTSTTPDPLSQYAEANYSEDLKRLLQPNVQYSSIGGINFHNVLSQELQQTKQYRSIILLPDSDVFAPILYKCLMPEQKEDQTSPSQITRNKNASEAFTQLYDKICQKLPGVSVQLGVWFTEEQERDPSIVKSLISKGVDDLLTDGETQNFRLLEDKTTQRLVKDLFNDNYKIPAQWVYLYQGLKDRHIYNRGTHLYYNKEEFGLQNGINLKVKEVEEILATSYFPKFQSLIFRPDEPEIVIEEYDDDIVKYLNTWRKNTWLEDPDDCDPVVEIPPAFDQFLKDMIPDEKERFYLIETMAFSVQYPKLRKKYAVTLLGPNRVGKSLLLDLIACMTSKPNITYRQWQTARRKNQIPKGRHSVQIDTDHLIGKNKMFLGEMLDVFVHEFYQPTNKDTVATQSTVKNLLTAESLFVEDKFISLHETLPFFNVWLATNHSDAIKSDDVAADQRFLVLKCTGRRAQPIGTDGDTHERPEWRHLPVWTSEQIDSQAEKVKSELEDIYQYLLHYQITTPNIRNMPMITEGLREMYNQGQISWANRRYKLELAERISEAIESQNSLFESPVMRPRDITRFFDIKGKETAVGMATTALEEYMYKASVGNKKNEISLYFNKELITDLVNITWLDPRNPENPEAKSDPCLEGWQITTKSQEVNRDRYYFINKFNEKINFKSFQSLYPPLWEAIPATTETNTPSTTRSLSDAEKYKEYPLFHNQRIAHAMICVALEKYTQPEFNQLQRWLNHLAEARGKRKSKCERITQANTKKQAVLRLYGELVLDKMNGENRRIRVAELDIRNPLLADLMERAYY